ncbi:hypothetical protein EDC94DRAFT_659113 [Helicostylum pulchrum]|nr:hypothetical protein EDC94DRAFT_659113 [Helicostylum pulchrum]
MHISIVVDHSLNIFVNSNTGVTVVAVIITAFAAAAAAATATATSAVDFFIVHYGFFLILESFESKAQTASTNEKSK